MDLDSELQHLSTLNRYFERIRAEAGGESLIPGVDCEDCSGSGVTVVTFQDGETVDASCAGCGGTGQALCHDCGYEEAVPEVTAYWGDPLCKACGEARTQEEESSFCEWLDSRAEGLQE